MNMKLKKIIFFIVLASFIIFVNLDVVPLLDALAGFEWSGPVLVFLKANTQGLIIIFILSLYFEYIRDGKLRRLAVYEDDYKNLLAFALKGCNSKADRRNLVNEILSKDSGNIEVDPLLNYIICEKPIYTNVEIRHVLKDDANDDEKYTWDYDISFQSNEKSVVFAVTRNSRIQDRISKNCKKINDVIVVPSISEDGRVRDEIDKVLGGIHLNKIEKNAGGLTVETGCEIKVLPRSMHCLYLNGVEVDDLNKIVLLKANLGLGSKKLRLSFPSVTLNKADHYLYWLTDRIMHIDKIVFDLNQFCENREMDFMLHPFIANHSGSKLDFDRSKVQTIEVGNWVSICQGAILSWR